MSDIVPVSFLIVTQCKLTETSWAYDIQCDALRDSVPFVQFKKCEKHP